MHKDTLTHLSFELAKNSVAISFSNNQNLDDIWHEFMHAPKGEIKRARNILVIGAGASHNVHKALPLADKAKDDIRKNIEKKYSIITKDLKEGNLISQEIKKRKTIFKNENDGEDFESVLFACSKYFKNDVIKEIESLYKYKYPVSLFYEIVAHLLKHKFLDVVINFNFDEILDNAIEEELTQGDYRYIFSDGHAPARSEMIDELIMGERLKSPVYIKPHGTISHPSTLRFTKEDYFDLPGRINDTLSFLLEGRYGYAEDCIFNVNLIIAGFGLNSFDFNDIIKRKWKAPNENNIFYFDISSLDMQEKLISEKLGPIEKQNFYPYQLKDEDDLDAAFFRLWQKIYEQFKLQYKPRDIHRHVIVHSLFNYKGTKNYKFKDLQGIFNLETSIESEQQIAQPSIKFQNYLQDRIYVELGIEILNSYEEGMLNMFQLSQGRVGKYFSLLKKYDPTKNIYHFFDNIGMERYKGYLDDMWKFPNTDESYKSTLFQHISNYLINTTSKYKLQHLYENEQLHKAVIGRMEKKGIYLDICSNYQNVYMSVYQGVGEENILSTDLIWRYTFNKFFTINTDWHLILAVSESASVFCKLYHSNLLEGKKIIPICSFSTHNRETRSKMITSRFKREGEKKPNCFCYLKEDKNDAVIGLLPWHTHNQHLILFAKINNSMDDFELAGGITYERRLLSKRVNPILIEKNNTEDLKRLLNSYLNYLDRAQEYYNFITDSNEEGFLEMSSGTPEKKGKKLRSREYLKQQIINCYLTNKKFNR